MVVMKKVFWSILYHPQHTDAIYGDPGQTRNRTGNGKLELFVYFIKILKAVEISRYRRHDI